MKISKFRKKILEHSETVHKPATVQANNLALKTLEKYVGNKHIEDLTIRDGEKVISSIVKAGRKNTTANGYMRSIDACLQRAVDWGWISEQPFKKIKKLKVPKQVPPFIPRERLGSFIAGIKDIRKRLTISAYLATGRRRVELLSLRWNDIYWDREEYHVSMFKTGEEKDLPINAWFKSILLEIQGITKGSGSNLIFPWWTHEDSVTHFVKEELVGAGFPSYHLHHLRHTFATLYMAEGGDIFYLKELLGHSDIKTSMIYAHVNKTELRKESNRVCIPVEFGQMKEAA